MKTYENSGLRTAGWEWMLPLTGTVSLRRSPRVSTAPSTPALVSFPQPVYVYTMYKIIQVVTN